MTTETFKFGDDYYSYALFAFYMFNEQERNVVKAKSMDLLTRFKKSNPGKVRFSSVMDDTTIFTDLEPREHLEKKANEELDLVFLKYHRSERNRIVFFKLLFIFTIEICFLAFSIHAMVSSGIGFPFDFQKVALKFFCVYAVHVMQQPAIIQSIERLEYVFRHPEGFESKSIPLISCLMKVCLAFMIEFTCIVVTAYNNDNITIIMDYAALLVLNNIDIFYT